MKLWILKAVEGLPDNDNPWEPWYDCCFGMVVRAENEIDARKIAQKRSGDEGSEYMRKCKCREPWIISKYSTCVELGLEGTSEMIIADVHWA